MDKDQVLRAWIDGKPARAIAQDEGTTIREVVEELRSSLAALDDRLARGLDSENVKG